MSDKVHINLLVPREYEGKTYGPGEGVTVPAGLAREMGVKGSPVKEAVKVSESETKTESAPKAAAKPTAKK